MKHLNQPIVKEEFYDPIIDILDISIGETYALIIHGMGDKIRDDHNDLDIDMVVGVGNGDPPRYTMSKTEKENFLWKINFMMEKLTTY
jgi:hypothetical protein